MSFKQAFLQHSVQLYSNYKKLGENALAQVAEEHLSRKIDPESNSIAVIVKHLRGNMRSRWTDFLHTDGEKEWRQRDTEFEDSLKDFASVREAWEEGWFCVLGTLEALEEADLDKTVFIRGEPHSVMEAILRQLGHYAYHIGQLVLLARHFAGEQWESLSVPKGQSEQFNARMFGKGSGAKGEN